MTYDKIYSQFYRLITDPQFFQLNKEDAYDMMKDWLHSAISVPYIKKIFSSIKLKDELNVMTYTLKNPVDADTDEDFVINVFAQYMLIAWMRPKIDTAINLATIVNDKKVSSNYSANISRLKGLETDLKKYIRDYGYQNNTYLND